jgi:predicted Co/Zn/Cd cation transporter (cation efflux family)
MRELSMFELTGIGGALVLVLDLYALISILGSDAGTGRKVLWSAIVIVMPIFGFCLWLFLGPRRAAQARDL